MVGDLIRRSREGRGLSQRALAAAVGVGFPHVSKVETGHETPSDELLVRIADTLSLDADELVLAAGRVPEKYVRVLVADPERAVAYLRAYEPSAAGGFDDETASAPSGTGRRADDETTGAWVARRRRALGLTQVDLGERLGRSESWVSQVERDVRRVDRVSVIERLREVLGGDA